MPTNSKYHAYTGDLLLKGTTPDPGIYGGKGAGLLTMAANDLPVPIALVITTDAWKHYQETHTLHASVTTAVHEMIQAYPDSMFSVRSGAPVSMPGMMDTILNVGVTGGLDDQYPGAYSRFATSWLEIVKGVPKSRIAELTDKVAERASNPEHSRALLHGVIQHSELVSIPESRYAQVLSCISAVFDSWNTPRAKAYRKMHDIPENMGTACIIQRMVMGTAPGLSGSGVMFSRNPATGENKVTGEIAFNAQGEEVVAGEITPYNLSELPDFDGGIVPEHEGQHYALLKKLEALAAKLEKHYGDVQDIEFTVESGELYVLQTRLAKMSARARIVTACDLGLGLNHYSTALEYIKDRVNRSLIAQTKVPYVDSGNPVAEGLAASPGAIAGKIVYRDTPLSKVNKNSILVAEDTSPDDFPIMAKCGGILTKTGGFTCHSAVVARGIGVPAVVGCDALKFTDGKLTVSTLNSTIEDPDTVAPHGAVLTIDGSKGSVYLGKHDVKTANVPRELYHTLFEIVSSQGYAIPEDVYFYDNSLGPRVLLPLDINDMDQVDTQVARAHGYVQQGKQVAYGFELQGVGEGMFAASPINLFQKLAENYGPDLHGAKVAYGIPPSIADQVSQLLGVVINTTDTIEVLDLLDLLGDN